MSVSHTPTLVVGVRHYVCGQCPAVYRVPLTHNFTRAHQEKFCEGVLVTKVCSVFLIAALLRANTLHDQQHAKEEQRQAELRVGARGFTT